MNNENTEDQEELREMLLFYLDKMGATQVELSAGMGVSRPVVTNFLNKDKKQRLPVDRAGLIKLCESLQQGKASKKKSKTVAENNSQELESLPDELLNPDKLRELLGNIGVDELLESAGFLPEKSKIIRVTPDRFFEVAKVVALLEFLELDDLVPTTQEFLAITSHKIEIYGKKLLEGNSQDQEKEYSKQEHDFLKDLIDNLENNPTRGLKLGLKQRLQVIDKLQRKWRNLRAEGKTNFTQKEAVRLFMSIAIKEQMPKNESDLHIIVKKTEFQTLSKYIPLAEAYKDLHQKFVQIGCQAECDLKTPGSCLTTQMQPNSLELLNPVIMAIVTCSLKHHGESEELIEWIYTSGNTILENAIGACSLHLGLPPDTANMNISTNTLAGSIDSLMETTVILGEKHKYQGIWVDRDSVITMLQAMVCAAQQWLVDKNTNGKLDLEIYTSACKSLAELRKRLTQARKAFQNFQFLDDECKPTEIKKIADMARDELQKIPQEQIYFTYRLNFYRCYFFAKRLELRLSNTQGNTSNIKPLNEEIKQVLAEDKKIEQELIPMQALIQSEIYLYELSRGHEPNLFDAQQRSNWLKLPDWDSKIKKVIQSGYCYKDPGLDIYKALSEIYGNAARIEFYLSYNKNTLETAAENLLKAAHYALRIGSTQRVTRWLALAGRVWVRLGNAQLSIQAFKCAEKLANTDLTTGHSENFRQAVLSAISLLNGEYLLLIENDYIKALESFLKALKGSVYLGLNRRIGDALFDIYRCSKYLDNFSIKEGLNRVFMGEDQLTEANKGKLNPTSNYTSEKVLELLYKLWNQEDHPTWFQVREQFSQLAADTWQKWHEDTKPGTKTKHPIAEMIKNDTWLHPVN